MSKEPEIIKCKFAGDPEDEYCKACNGLTLEEGGESFPATSCGGYEATPPAPQEKPEEPDEKGGLAPSTDEPDAIPVQGLTTVIRAESGLTREINGTYYKFMFIEERVLPEGADLAAEKADLWKAVNDEVDRQMDDVIHG